jgi:hypothetical protein
LTRTSAATGFIYSHGIKTPRRTSAGSFHTLGIRAHWIPHERDGNPPELRDGGGRMRELLIEGSMICGGFVCRGGGQVLIVESEPGTHQCHTESSRRRGQGRREVKGAYQLALLVGLGCLLIVPRFVTAVHDVPALVGDSLYFVPVAVEKLLYNDFSNPFLSPFHSGGGPFTWHGWLQPYLLSGIGRLFSASDVAALRLIELGVVSLTVILFVFNIVDLGVRFVVKAAALAGAIGALTLNMGRPEVTAGLILILWATFHARYRIVHPDTLAGIAIGILGVTQPTVAILAAVWFLTYRSYSLRTGRFIASGLQVGLISLAITVVLTLLFFPFTLRDWIMGLVAQAGVVGARSDGRWSTYYLFASPDPLLILWFAMCAVTLASGWKQFDVSFRTAFFCSLLLVSAYLFWMLGLRVPPTHYNVTVFLPVAIYVLISRISADPSAAAGRALAIGMVATGAIVLVAQVRLLIVSEISAISGVPPEQIAAQIHADIAAGRKVAVTPMLAMADFRECARNSLVKVLRNSDEAVGWKEADVLYLPQAASGSGKARRYPGLELEQDRFLDGIYLFGVKLSNTPVGYNYAKYRRVNTE